MTAREPSPDVPMCPHCLAQEGVREFEDAHVAQWEHAIEGGGCGRLFSGSAVEFQRVQVARLARKAERDDRDATARLLHGDDEETKP